MNVVEFDSNDASRTWIFKGDAATAVVEAYDAMLAALRDVDERFAEAAKPVRDEAAVAESALRERHEAEFAALRKEASARLEEAQAPFDAESAKASAGFHAVVHGLAPEMSRDQMPIINLNQYPYSGLVTIVERR